MINVHDDKGFSPIGAILIFVIVSIIGFTGWYVWQAKHNETKTVSEAAHVQALVSKNLEQSKSTVPTTPQSSSDTTSPPVKPTNTSSTPSTNDVTPNAAPSPQPPPATTSISEYYNISSDGTSATESPVTTKLKNVTSVTVKVNLTCSGVCQFKLVSDDYTLADKTVYTGSQTISYTISTPGNHIFYNQYTPNTKFGVGF
jgi:type II secretory pathway pseudopilin PulG